MQFVYGVKVPAVKLIALLVEKNPDFVARVIKEYEDYPCTLLFRLLKQGTDPSKCVEAVLGADEKGGSLLTDLWAEVQSTADGYKFPGTELTIRYVNGDLIVGLKVKNSNPQFDGAVELVIPYKEFKQAMGTDPTLSVYVPVLYWNPNY